MIVIYEHAGGIARLALPTRRQRVVVAPAVFEDQPVLGDDGEPLLDQNSGAPTVVHVEIAPATYRDETATEVVARMIAADHMPDLPWLHYMILADDHPASSARLTTIDMGDWSSPAAITLSPDLPTQGELLAYSADKRWRVEVGGCLDQDNRSIATDRDSQTKLIAEMVAIGGGLRADPSPWKLRNGSYATLSNADMLAVIVTARNHIAAAFAVEGAVVAAVMAGDITTISEIDDPTLVGLPAWPAGA